MKYKNIRYLERHKFNVKGMICTSCEERIVKKIKQIKGIVSVQASYQDAELIITSLPKAVKVGQISKALDSLGYEIMTAKEVRRGNPAKTTKTNESLSLGKLIGIGILIYLFYPVLENIIGFDFIPEVNQNMGYSLLFIVGLLTSLHCVAMCGGINISQCVSNGTASCSEYRTKLKPSLLYNAGRVIAYTFVGGVVGAIGSVIDLPGSAKGIVAVVAGVMMVIIGLNMLNVFPGLRKFTPKLPGVFHQINKENANRGPFFVGLLNGFMPCGPLQAMQIYALGTGSILTGALSMFFFSLGTVPLMFGLGAVSSFLSSKFTKKMLRTSAVLVVVLGIIMLNRGLSLSGVSLASMIPVNNLTVQSAQAEKAVIQGDIQIVTTNLESGRYTPIIVQQGIPVRWTIEADSSNLNGCNNALQIPAYNLQKKLYPGKNVIEFIPEQAGNIPYSCWMGMIRSNITVVPN